MGLAIELISFEYSSETISQGIGLEYEGSGKSFEMSLIVVDNYPNPREKAIINMQRDVSGNHVKLSAVAGELSAMLK